MAWFRKMGLDEVAYHEATVVGRGDDHPGRALAYYGSRGETPLRWGGAGAARLGLEGEVTPDAYDAAFGPGGFQGPVTFALLAKTDRPGFELVVGAHKSVAILGVAGRAEDMHSILDAETDGTMGWLDECFKARGGRRGQDRHRVTAGGLTYAVTRHATSRAGDPSPHDHVLVANVIEPAGRGRRFLGLDSAALRDTAEAATMVGRQHSAWRAVELGYRIEADDGPSGRLRHWRIAAVPDAVCDQFSKRSDEIADHLAESGHDSYRSKGRRRPGDTVGEAPRRPRPAHHPLARRARCHWLARPSARRDDRPERRACGVADVPAHGRPDRRPGRRGPRSRRGPDGPPQGLHPH